MQTVLRAIQDLPAFPPRGEGVADHVYLAEAAKLGPIVHDRYGILVTFSYDHLIRINDNSLTRQPELDTAQMKGIGSGPIYELFANSLLFSNDPRHQARRAPLARAFARPLMEALRPQVRELAAALIRPAIGQETDFLAVIAGPLPARVIAMILGAPEADIPRFTRLVYSAIRALSLRSDAVLREAARDLAELNAYVEELLAERRAGRREDFLTEYLARTADSDLSADEVRTQIVTVILAGADTTRIALSSTFAQLIQHPEQWALLQGDPERIKAAAASEGLRFDPVIGMISRVAIREFAFEGVRIPQGAMLGPCVVAALRDPAVYRDPDTFDIRRSDHPRWHPVFGAGAHRCLGEALARAEIEEALVALAQLSPAPALVGRPPTLRGLGATRGIDAMTVRL